MVELRKRKTPPPGPPAKTTKKRGNNPVEETIATVKEAAVKVKTAITEATVSNGFPAVGSTIDLETFGGEIETHDGKKTTLKQLVDESAGGVVLFTYPKASTPGCTKQACLFRDDYTPLTATGFSIFGLSRDSPRSNTTFKTKQSLPYTLLCDSAGTLISAIGLGTKGKSTATRGVFVVDKTGEVLAAEAGGPDATVSVVKKLVTSGGHSAAPVTTTSTDNEVKKAEPSAEASGSADTATNIDSSASAPAPAPAAAP